MCVCVCALERYRGKLKEKDEKHTRTNTKSKKKALTEIGQHRRSFQPNLQQSKLLERKGLFHCHPFWEYVFILMSKLWMDLVNKCVCTIEKKSGLGVFDV